MAANLKSGSPCATLFITVLFLPQLTENLQYQRVIKDQAVPGEAEAALSHISSASESSEQFRPTKRSASAKASTGQKHAGRGRRTCGCPAAGRQFSAHSDHWAGITFRPHTAPRSAPQTAALVSVSPPRMTVSTTPASRLGVWCNNTGHCNTRSAIPPVLASA